MIDKFFSGNYLLFHGLGQSTIGDVGFPCLVRDGTEGVTHSIITRTKLAIVIPQRINPHSPKASADNEIHEIEDFGIS